MDYRELQNKLIKAADKAGLKNDSDIQEVVEQLSVVESLNEQIENSTRSLNSSKIEKEKIEAEVLSAQEFLSSVDIKISHAGKKLQIAEEDIKEKLSKAEDISVSIASLSDQKRELESVLDSVDKTIRDNALKLEEQKKSFSDLLSKYNDEVSALMIIKNKLIEESDKLKNILAEDKAKAEKDLSIISDKISLASKSLEEKALLIEDKDKYLVGLCQDIDTNEQTLSDIQDEITSAEIGLSDIKKSIQMETESKLKAESNTKLAEDKLAEVSAKAGNIIYKQEYLTNQEAYIRDAYEKIGLKYQEFRM